MFKSDIQASKIVFDVASFFTKEIDEKKESVFPVKDLKCVVMLEHFSNLKERMFSVL